MKRLITISVLCIAAAVLAEDGYTSYYMPYGWYSERVQGTAFFTARGTLYGFGIDKDGGLSSGFKNWKAANGNDRAAMAAIQALEEALTAQIQVDMLASTVWDLTHGGLAVQYTDVNGSTRLAQVNDVSGGKSGGTTVGTKLDTGRVYADGKSIVKTSGMFAVNGWSSGTPAAGKTLSAWLSGGQGGGTSLEGDRIVIRSANGDLQYLPIGPGSIASSNATAQVDEASIVTVESAGDSYIQLNNFDSAGIGQIPYATSSGLEWSDPPPDVSVNNHTLTVTDGDSVTTEQLNQFQVTGFSAASSAGGSVITLTYTAPNGTAGQTMTANLSGTEISVSPVAGDGKTIETATDNDQVVLSVKGAASNSGKFLMSGGAADNTWVAVDGKTIEVASNQLKLKDFGSACQENLAGLLTGASDDASHRLVSWYTGGNVHYLPLGRIPTPSSADFATDAQTKAVTIKGSTSSSNAGKVLKCKSGGGVEWGNGDVTVTGTDGVSYSGNAITFSADENVNVSLTQIGGTIVVHVGVKWK